MPSAFTNRFFYLISNKKMIGSFIFSPRLRSLYFPASDSPVSHETRVFIGFYAFPLKYKSRYFFVEYAELRVLPFDPVVEKNVREVARNPDILNSGDSGIDHGLCCSWIFLRFPQLWKTLWKTGIHR
jgi:hypothetical protein